MLKTRLPSIEEIFSGKMIFGLLDYRTGYGTEAKTVISSGNGWTFAREGSACTAANEKLGLEFRIQAEEKENGIDLFIPKDSLKEKSEFRFYSLRFFPEMFRANEGDEGYYLLAQQSGVLTRFNSKTDSEHHIGIYGQGMSECNMPTFGMVQNNICYSCIITQGYCDFTMVMETSHGAEKAYRFYPMVNFRYEFNVRRMNYPMVNDDIRLRFRAIPLDGRSGASVLASEYRNYSFGIKRMEPIAERMKKYPELAYAVCAPEIRVRMGCKWPFPPLITEQTIENEPEVHAFCTFDQVKEIVDALKKLGLEKASFCLVGWAAKGHDGRYPQILPVEETFGGEAKLRELTSYIEKNGYRVSAHDNHYDSYRISEDPIEPYLMRTQDSGPYRDGVWGGGQAYLLCPEAQYKTYTERNLKAIRDLGFHGIHFTDCLSSTGLKLCWDQNHPLTKTQCAYWRTKILAKAKEISGGVQSEGSFDFAAGVLDRVMYAEDARSVKERREYADEIVPLYEMVYHGTLMYCVNGDGINAVPGSEEFLHNVAFGGVPYFYFYRHFATKNYEPGTNIPIRGKFKVADFSFSTLASNTETIKRSSETFIDELGHLQTCFIKEFTWLAENISRTDYSNGQSVYVNASDTDFENDTIRLAKRSYMLK